MIETLFVWAFGVCFVVMTVAYIARLGRKDRDRIIGYRPDQRATQGGRYGRG